MLAGTFAMNAYQLTDAWFVSRLGTVPLAAMSFTFPVIMLLTFMARSVGTSAMTLISHALGRREQDEAAVLTTNALLLSVLIVIVAAVGGYATIDPVFTALGADSVTLPEVARFMRIWYLGIGFMVIPMLGNDIIIAAGEARTASAVMVGGTVLNALINPVLIFGYLGFPALGIRGSAWATVVSQAVTAVAVLYLLHRKLGFILIERQRLAAIFACWRRIIRFAIPTTFGNLLIPLAGTVITTLTARFGAPAIAATGAASRVEMFAFLVPMTFGMTMIPFVGQNFGAGRLDRILNARRFTAAFALGYGLLLSIAFYAIAPWIARLFSSDPEVLRILTQYLRIVPWGYGLMEIHRYCGFFLIGVQRPFLASLLNVLRLVVFLIPLSLLGANLGQVRGLFLGRLASDLLAGILGWLAVTAIAKRIAAKSPALVSPAAPATPIDETA